MIVRGDVYAEDERNVLKFRVFLNVTLREISLVNVRGLGWMQGDKDRRCNKILKYPSVLEVKPRAFHFSLSALLRIKFASSR